MYQKQQRVVFVFSLVANLVTTSKALVTRSDALVLSSEQGNSSRVWSSPSV